MCVTQGWVEGEFSGSIGRTRRRPSPGARLFACLFWKIGSKNAGCTQSTVWLGDCERPQSGKSLCRNASLAYFTAMVTGSVRAASGRANIFRDNDQQPKSFSWYGCIFYQHISTSIATCCFHQEPEGLFNGLFLGRAIEQSCWKVDLGTKSTDC